MESTPVDELDVEEVLARAEGNQRALRAAETENFVLAAHYADLHSPQSRPAATAPLPGMERARRLGGAGTPAMWEFAIADLALALGTSVTATRYLVADALDTRHRLPRLWARVVAGQVRVYVARHIAQHTRHLGVDAARTVDDDVAEYADGRKGWADLQRLVAAKIIEADPEAAARREADAAARRFANPSRSSEHGMKMFLIRAGTATITRFDATVAYLAAALKALGDPDNQDDRRIKACLIMANPTQATELLQAYANHRANHREDPTDENDGPDGPDGDPAPEPQPCPSCTGPAAGFTRPARFRPGDTTPDGTRGGDRWRCDPSRLLPTVTVYLHLSQDTVTRDHGGVARWQDEGPVTVQYVREHLAPYQRFTIKPVIDLANQAPVDAYEIPERHREAVRLLTPADTYPYAPSTPRFPHIDHTLAHQPTDQGGAPGQSGLGNYGPMSQHHHMIKTFGPLDVRQPFPGIYIWRNQHNQYFLVDHTGTRRITRTG